MDEALKPNSICLCGPPSQKPEESAQVLITRTKTIEATLSDHCGIVATSCCTHRTFGRSPNMPLYSLAFSHNRSLLTGILPCKSSGRRHLLASTGTTATPEHSRQEMHAQQTKTVFDAGLRNRCTELCRLSARLAVAPHPTGPAQSKGKGREKKERYKIESVLLAQLTLADARASWGWWSPYLQQVDC